MINFKIKLANAILLAFYFFIAAGPVPIHFSFLYVHHLITFLTALIILAIFNSNKTETKYNISDLALIILQISYIPSVILSHDITESLIRYLINLGFFVTFLLLTKIKIDEEFYYKNYKLSLIALLVISFTIIIIYIDIDKTDIHRMALAVNYDDLRTFGRQPQNAVDPNHTGMGLMLLTAFCLPGLHKYHSKIFRFFLIYPIIVLVFICMAILESRTSMIGLFIAVLVYNYCLLRNNFIYFCLMTILCSVLFLLLITHLLDAIGIIELIKSRFDLNGIIIDGTAEGGRIFLMKEAASLFTMNYVTFLFGYGFYLTNPHNEYFKVFINSGTISGLLFLTYLLLFYFKLKKNSINKTNTFLIVLTPIIVAMTTYGHVMLFWLAFGMSWILSFVDLEEQKNTKTLTLSVNYS